MLQFEEKDGVLERGFAPSTAAKGCVALAITYIRQRKARSPAPAAGRTDSLEKSGPASSKTPMVAAETKDSEAVGHHLTAPMHYPLQRAGED